MTHSKSIEKRASFNIIRYANCWEDTEILLEALNIKENGHYLSICSAGDNSLAMLTHYPAMVVAVDISLPQIACCELKKVAFLTLEYPDLLIFLGFRQGTLDIGKTYQQLKNSLSPESRGYWDHHIHILETGLIHTGKFEKYFHLFKNYIIPLIHSSKTVDHLLTEKSEVERADFYTKIWNNRRWKLLFKIFFSQYVMGKFGRDPEFFRYVETQVADNILKRTQYALSVLPTHNNPYLTYILKGDYGKILPYFIQEQNYRKIKENLQSLVLFQGTLQEAHRHYGLQYDGFNLSDIFEYMDDAIFKALADFLIEIGKDQARYVYWNMLVNRQISQISPGPLTYLKEISDTLFQQDKAFFYQKFLVEEKNGSC